MEQVIQSGHFVNGQFFATKQEAIDFIRKPQIEAALLEATGKNKELTKWFMDNQEAIEMAFETGTIRRVTKQERKQLQKAVDYIKTLTVSDHKELKFLIEHADAMSESFKHLAQKRLSDEEKEAKITESLNVVTEGNKNLITFILTNKDALLACFEAGKVKREINPKAADALAEYRAKKAAEKATREAAQEKAA